MDLQTVAIAFWIFLPVKGGIIFNSPAELNPIVGSNITIDCRYEEPGSFIVWKFKPKNKGSQVTLARGPEILSSTKTTLKGQARLDGDFKYTSNLTLIDVKWTIHDGEYECSRLNGSTPPRSTEVKVIVLPHSIKVIPPQVSLQPGDRLELRCSASGHPSPTFTWTRQKGVLPSGLPMHIDPVLSVDKLAKHDGGMYYCTATNYHGRGVVASVTVEVLFPPEVTTPKTLIYSKPQDRDVELTCVFDAYPSVDVEWFADGVNVSQFSNMVPKSEDDQTVSTRKTFILLIELVKHRDLEKTYVCVGKNSNGQASANITLKAKSTTTSVNTAPPQDTSTIVTTRTVDRGAESATVNTAPPQDTSTIKPTGTVDGGARSTSRSVNTAPPQDTSTIKPTGTVDRGGTINPTVTVDGGARSTSRSVNTAPPQDTSAINPTVTSDGGGTIKPTGVVGSRGTIKSTGIVDGGGAIKPTRHGNGEASAGCKYTPSKLVLGAALVMAVIFTSG